MNSDYKKLNFAYLNNTLNNVKEDYPYYNATGCKAGTYCPNSKEEKRFLDNSCPAGFYCIEPNGVNVILKPLPTKCPQGFYCPPNTSIPMVCPSDKPISKMMSKSINDCRK